MPSLVTQNSFLPVLLLRRQ